MTEQEINIAIAETCGWNRVEGEECFFDNGCEQIYIENLPDYCNDLNAMHEAEKYIMDESSVIYKNELEKVSCIWHSTARQKAVAFLKAVGKWKDSENQSNEVVEEGLKKEETITMKLSDYDCIISKLDNARKEADFWKVKCEALLEEPQNEHRNN